ncbi:hypothetical protein SASPL_144257 [Salvia splendens]|uniref:Uncharacterized protein n=1 Tax=Salvia splendens TaxID=180675 RepID=A0A8X8ZAH4_SALSN|nr:hypothetical protein SASPL_144257 [Salvia splendens]
MSSSQESNSGMTYRDEKAIWKEKMARRMTWSKRCPKHLGDQVDTELSIGGIYKSVSGQSSRQGHAGVDSDSSSLIADIGLDNVISCFYGYIIEPEFPVSCS